MAVHMATGLGDAQAEVGPWVSQWGALSGLSAPSPPVPEYRTTDSPTDILNFSGPRSVYCLEVEPCPSYFLEDFSCHILFQLFNSLNKYIMK